MKFILLLILCLTFCCTQIFAADLNIETTFNSTNIRLENVERDTDKDYITTVIPLPARRAAVQINSMETDLFSSNGDFISKTGQIDQQAVQIIDSFVLRELHGFTVKINLRSEENGQQRLIRNLDFNVTAEDQITPPDYISEEFSRVYKGFVDNYETSYLYGLPFSQPKILILSHDHPQIANALQPFLDWKRSKGFIVTVFHKSDIAPSPTNNQVRDFVADYYNNADIKPEHLIIIGDVTGSFSYPTFYYGEHNDATDHPYTMIEGDDYLPEMFVGRISILSAIELATIVNKTIYYERDIDMNDTDWMTRSLAVAGNYASGDLIPISPVLMSRWLLGVWIDNEYTQADSIFWWPGDGYMTQDVINAVNDSYQYINYRGWGAQNGWHYPRFYSSHLEQTYNQGRPPVVFSIVCNTGDFAHSTVEECFGEVWMKKGTPGTIDGAVAFFGPSYLHTSTEFNNSMSSGINWAIQDESTRITNLAAACLMGKLNIYRGYPNEIEPGTDPGPERYFHVYNILSDPSLNMWRLIPGTLDIDIPEYIDQGTNFLEISLPGLNEGYVTATRDNENYKFTRIENGYAFIELDPENTDDITVTITNRKHVPVQATIQVNTSNNISITNYAFDRSLLLPGENVTLNAVFKNFHSETYNNAQVAFSSPTEGIEILTENVDLGNLGPGETTDAEFVFHLNADTPRFSPVLLEFYITPSENTAKIHTLTGGIHLQIENYTVDSNNGFINPGQTSDIEVYITNHGDFNALDVVAEINVGTNAIIINTPVVEFGNLAIGESANATINVTVEEDAFIGRLAWFDLDFTDSTGLISHSSFSTTIGEVNNTHPTGPDDYGYYAYDSFDVGYEMAPVFNWVNIDPEDGRNGTVLYIGDDESALFDLPFSFRFYGIDYNQVHVVDNGWLTFIPTWETNFRNWPLPSPIAPRGIIAPFWDDIKGLPENDDLVRIVYYHDEENNRFIISWLDCYNIGQRPDYSVKEEFQVILKPRENDDGDILFQYNSVWNQNHTRNFSTTGIMNHNRRDGLLYSYALTYPPSASEISPGLAIRFTTVPPDPYLETDDQIVQTDLRLRLNNYPNPFNPETTIRFNLPETDHVRLDVFNILGQKVVTLINENLSPGHHSVVWSGKDSNNLSVGSGIYFYKLETLNKVKVNKMILLK